MSTMQSIITQGFRELNLIAIGKAPTPDQNTEGLILLTNVIDTTVSDDLGEDLRDWPLGNFDRLPQEQLRFSQDELNRPAINRRLIALNEASETVFFPLAPSDGSLMAIQDPFNRLAAFPITLHGNTRTIEGTQSVQADVNGLSRTWLYRADTANWVRLTSLTLTDELPFPSKYDFYFSIGLAMRLSGRTGRQISETTAVVYDKLQQKLVSQYLQSEIMARNEDINSYHMGEQSYANSYSGGRETFIRGF